MLSHPEALAHSFEEWLVARQASPHQWELPSDGSLSELIALWMQDVGATEAATYDAFARSVVLIVIDAVQSGLSFNANDGREVNVTVPQGSAAWWMLEPMEFEAARAEHRQRRNPVKP